MVESFSKKTGRICVWEQAWCLRRMGDTAFARGVCPLRQHAKNRSNSQKLKKITFFAVFSRWIKALPLVTALGTVGESFPKN
jgi:hypothetical protein